VNDPYLADLLRRVDRKNVGSGIGERPAVVHLRDWKIVGYASGLACIAPELSQALLTSCLSGDYRRAEEIRRRFLPLEDLRDAWGASRVLQAVIELAGFATTGSVPPFQSPLGAERLPELLKAVQAFQKDAAGASIAPG
jgi:dihydrodipicolinate synthase/N-acetylneuraminate lyase